MERTTKCKNKAEYLVPWAGKQLKCCHDHAVALSAIGEAIGSPVQVAKIAMEDDCEMMDDLKED